MVCLTDESLISGFTRALHPSIKEWVMLSKLASLQEAFETAWLKYTTARAMAMTPRSKEISLVEPGPQMAAIRTPDRSKFFPNDAWRKPAEQMAKRARKR